VALWLCSVSSRQIRKRKRTERTERTERWIYGIRPATVVERKGHQCERANCPDKQDEKRDEKSKSGKEGEKSEPSTSKKPPTGTLYTAISHAGSVAHRGLANTFYVDSGASDHLVPSRGELRAYKELLRLLEFLLVVGFPLGH